MIKKGSWKILSVVKNKEDVTFSDVLDVNLMGKMGKNPQMFRDCCLFFSEKYFLTALFLTEEEKAVSKHLRIFPLLQAQRHLLKFTSRTHLDLHALHSFNAIFHFM